MQLQQHQKELQKLQIQSLAITIEDEQTAQDTVQSHQLTFPVLIDPKHSVIDAFQVYSEKDNYALPALFLIDLEGTIRFGRVGPAHGPFDDQALPDALQWVRDHSGEES